LDHLLANACLPEETSRKLSRMDPVMQMNTLNVLSVRRDGLYIEFGVDFYLSPYAR
jgi:hypothetical protein